MTEIVLPIYKKVFSKCVVVLAKGRRVITDHLDLLYTFTNESKKNSFKTWQEFSLVVVSFQIYNENKKFRRADMSAL